MFDTLIRMPREERLDLLYRAIDELLKRRADIVNGGNEINLIRDLTDVCHRRGLLSSTCSVNEATEVDDYAQSGVDFIISDDPRVVVTRLSARKTALKGR